MKNKFIPLFIILSSLTIILGYISKIYLFSEDLIYESFSDQFTYSQINSIIEFRSKFEWLGYLLLPVLLLIKVTLVSVTIYLGVNLFNKKYSFLKSCIVSIKAEFIFLLIPIIKFIWFYFFQNNYSYNDIQFFYPLSALNLVGYQNLNLWFIYPLQILNLFELAYWFILAYLLGKELNISMDKGFKIVASSYGPALAIWVVAVMFFTLNYS